MKFLPLKKKKDFQRVLKAGKHVRLSCLTVVYLPAETARVAVCVGKKYGKSVVRNHIKRLLREAFRAHAEEVQVPCLFLLIPKPAETYSYALFQREIGTALRREKLC